MLRTPVCERPSANDRLRTTVCEAGTSKAGLFTSERQTSDSDTSEDAALMAKVTSQKLAIQGRAFVVAIAIAVAVCLSLREGAVFGQDLSDAISTPSAAEPSTPPRQQTTVVGMP